jgi:hypothetical protein
MPPSRRSTVIEIFAPGCRCTIIHECIYLHDGSAAYNFDYELLSRNMGHRVGVMKFTALINVDMGGSIMRFGMIHFHHIHQEHTMRCVILLGQVLI